MSEQEMQTIEISGVKMEVDMRTARRVETLKVGSRVKLLKKPGDYHDGKVYSGVVIGFEPFPSTPTIIVAYVEIDYTTADLKFLSFSSDTKDWELVASVDDALFDRDEVFTRLDKKIEEKKRELEDLQERRNYFATKFSTFWEPVQLQQTDAEEDK